MLESVIYARDHFLQISLENEDLTFEHNESIVIFPSHAYLVRKALLSYYSKYM